MIKMWRCLLSYFLVAIAISCGKHNGQLGMQSREKTALKIAAVAKKSTEEPSNQPKKKKRKSQSKDTWWDRWIKFCRVFLPIACFFYAFGGGQAMLTNASYQLRTDIEAVPAMSKCNFESCDLFYPENKYKTNFPFLLRVPANLSLENGTNVRSLFNGFFNSNGYPENIRKGACHILAERDINITSSNQNTTFCIDYLHRIRDFFSDTIKSVTSIESLRTLHFEPVENHIRMIPYTCVAGFSERHGGDKDSIKVRYYPNASLLEHRDNDDDDDDKEWFYHTWKVNKLWYLEEDVQPERKRKGEGITMEVEVEEHHYSPSSRFRAINEKCGNDRRDCIKRFRKEGVAILKSGKIEPYCTSFLNTVGARHWISSAAEYLFFANYLEALEKVHNYAKEKGFLNS
ncbi:MAG: hypothetical protein NQ127_00860 [Candidatus Cardinium sp.]|nr:hypothetical protein [Candidatus Cardinium sp.]